MQKQVPTGLLIAAIRRRVKQAVIEKMQAYDLSPGQFWVLVAISENEGASQRALAERQRMDEPTASRVIATLVKAGYVKMEEDPDDRRRLRARLTPQGRALTKKLLPIAEEIRGTIDSALDARERETLRALLSKVIAHIDGKSP